MQAEGKDGLDAKVWRALSELQDEGFELYRRFDTEVRQKNFHPFVPVEYDKVLQLLLGLRGPNRKFLEWGSANGVITIMADMLGFEAYGIELDGDLVASARELASKYGSRATFVEGSFLPAGYQWRAHDGDMRLGTVGHGPSGYLALNMPLDQFDIVYGYPWDGERRIMHDVFRRYARPDAILLMPDGVQRVGASR